MKSRARLYTIYFTNGELVRYNRQLQSHAQDDRLLYSTAFTGSELENDIKSHMRDSLVMP